MNSPLILRLFLAIPVPEMVRAELLRLQRELQPFLPPRAVRWTKPEQLHLTLKFLGNVPVADTGALSASVREVCAGAPPLWLRAEGLGFFPPARSPRVFWADIKSLDGFMAPFQAQLERSAQPFAEKREETEFTPHVTIARFEKLRRTEVEKLNTALPDGRIFGEWIAKEVHLIQSSLQPSGALHAILDTFKTKNQ